MRVNSNASNASVNDARIELPRPSGSFPVGVRDFEFTAETRKESFAPGERRRIPARAWYPASYVAGERRPYATEREIDLQVASFCTKVLGLDKSVADVFRVSSHSYENADAAAIGKCPTLVFSHGGMSYLQQNTVLMEHLASHGYLVVSISHPYVSMSSIYADGSVAPFADDVLKTATEEAANPIASEEYSSPDIARRLECRRWSAHESVFAGHFKEWVLDALCTIECLVNGSVPSGAKAILPLIDSDRLGTFGMSLGCSTSMAAHLDSRVKASVNLDGGVFDDRLIDKDIRVPTMVIGSDLGYFVPDNDTVHLCEFTYERLKHMGERADVQRFEVSGAAHIGFSDFALVPQAVKHENPLLSSYLGSIDGGTLVSLINDFVKAFFDKALLGLGDGVTEALVSRYPAAKPVDLSYIRQWALTSGVESAS